MFLFDQINESEWVCAFTLTRTVRSHLHGMCVQSYTGGAFSLTRAVRSVLHGRCVQSYTGCALSLTRAVRSVLHGRCVQTYIWVVRSHLRGRCVWGDDRIKLAVRSHTHGCAHTYKDCAFTLTMTVRSVLYGQCVHTYVGGAFTLTWAVRSDVHTYVGGTFEETTLRQLLLFLAESGGLAAVIPGTPSVHFQESLLRRRAIL